jgi:hypothetical protein
LKNDNARRRSAKLVYDDKLGFYVDEKNGKFIESGNQKSFTFPIYREGFSEKLENLILNYVPEKGEYKMLLARYNITPELAKQLDQEQLAKTDKTYYELLQANTNAGAYTTLAICTLTYAVIEVRHVHFEGNLVGDYKPDDVHYEWILIDRDCGYDSTGTGGALPGSDPSLQSGGGGNVRGNVITMPLLRSWQETALITSFTTDKQREWWAKDENQEAINNYILYLVENGATAGDLAFIRSLIDSTIESGLMLDAEASAKSPLNIDMTGVNGNSPEEQRFNSVYNKLKASPLFKSLLVNMFESSTRYNVSFEVGDLFGVYGRTLPPPSGPIINNTIIIDKSLLRGGSEVSIATTIVHEMIHAYLNVLRAQHGATPSELENDDLANCIVKYWTSQLWSPENQHNFMVGNFGPTIQQILVDIKDNLFTAEEIHKVEHPENYSNDYFLRLPGNITPENEFTQSTTVIPWNWENFFNWQSYEGLQDSGAFLQFYPKGSEEYYYCGWYIRIGTNAFKKS